ncbi:magnesium-dependent phosphatase 1-like [Bradysia coprophila]|uniref:magnesium-dependent phosphatase 1-like n=1 Tax=Bradysia coprophila TaxID=38358 RepID=UPI00187DC218|nr:magnesium-dependent phosphatase 1-like [Bradysia coprophila]
MAGKYLDKKIENLDLIVFDLDYTLWPFHVELERPPFKKQSNGQIVDGNGRKMKYFPDVPEVLQKLTSLGYQLAVASRTSAPKEGRQLVNLFGWSQYFDYLEIYPGCKVTHFNQFKKHSGIPLENMLFFDDESRNIVDINKIGSVAILVKNGVNFGVIENGIKEFVSRRS